MRDGNGRGFGFSAAQQSATKRRPMYFSPAIVSPCGMTLFAWMPIAHSRESGRSRPGHAAVRLQLHPARPSTGTL